MRVIIFLLLVLFPAISFSNVFVLFNPLSCNNCNSGLYALTRENLVKEIKLVIRSEFAGNSVELNELFEFTNFSKLRVIYSDSLYDAKQKSSSDKSEVIIEDAAGKEICRYELQMLNMSKLRGCLLHASNKNAPKAFSVDSLCMEELRRREYFPEIMKGEVLGVKTLFNSYAFYNIRSKKFTQLILPDKGTLIEALYKCHYKDSFSFKFPVIKSIFDESPTFKPSLNRVAILNENRLLIQYNMKDYIIKPPVDTIIIGKNVIAEYDLPKQKIISYYTFDTSVTNNFFVWYFYSFGKNFYAQGVKKQNGNFAFFTLKLNNKEKSFSLQSTLSIEKPTNYNLLKVSSMEEYNAVANNDCLAFDFDDSLYLLTEGRKIKIPFDETPQPGNYRNRNIQDVFKTDTHYYILYITDEQNLYVLKFNEHEVVKTFIGEDSRIYVYSGKFYGSGDKIIYTQKQSRCFDIVNLDKEKE